MFMYSWIADYIFQTLNNRLVHNFRGPLHVHPPFWASRTLRFVQGPPSNPFNVFVHCLGPTISKNNEIPTSKRSWPILCTKRQLKFPSLPDNTSANMPTDLIPKRCSSQRPDTMKATLEYVVLDPIKWKVSRNSQSSGLSITWSNNPYVHQELSTPFIKNYLN